MGRRPCCAKEVVNRGAWSVQEDASLANYINTHGAGKWRDLPQKAGLNRCGKSCRLRWLNYLRPDIIRGNFTDAEDELIIRLHKLLGNKWSLIAGRLPGRTDNEIKNYWNSVICKKLKELSSSAAAAPEDDLATHDNPNYQNDVLTPSSNIIIMPEQCDGGGGSNAREIITPRTPQNRPPETKAGRHEVIWTKAVRFRKPVFFGVHNHCSSSPHPTNIAATLDQNKSNAICSQDQVNDSHHGASNDLINTLFGDSDYQHHNVSINDSSTDMNALPSLPLSDDHPHHQDRDDTDYSDEMRELMINQTLVLQSDDISSYYNYNNNNHETNGDNLMQEIWRSVDDTLHEPTKNEPKYCVDDDDPHGGGNLLDTEEYWLNLKLEGI